MTLRRVDLNLLTVFDVVYTEGNLTQAARRIGMSQPAVSNALNRLRHLMDDELFVRDGRGIKPTPRSHSLAPQVREALLLIEDGLKIPARFDPTKHETFSIAGFDYCEVVVLPRLKQQLDRSAPHINLRSITGSSGEFAKPLRYGEIDLIVDYVPLKGKEYRQHELFAEDLVVLSRRGHPEISGHLDMDTFVSQRFVHREDRADEPDPEVDRFLRRHQQKRDIAISVTNWLALPQIVAYSDLICTCPKLFAEVAAEHFNLQLHPLPMQLASIPVYMIWHESQQEKAAHRWLRAQMKRAFRNARRSHGPVT